MERVDAEYDKKVLSSYKRFWELDLFPGTLEEYCQVKKEKFELIPPAKDMYICFKREWLVQMEEQLQNNKEVRHSLHRLVDVIEQGCVALIHYNLNSSMPYGVPVRKAT